MKVKAKMIVEWEAELDPEDYRTEDDNVPTSDELLELYENAIWDDPCDAIDNPAAKMTVDVINV